jgi:hypothetical protein
MVWIAKLLNARLYLGSGKHINNLGGGTSREGLKQIGNLVLVAQFNL